MDHDDEVSLKHEPPTLLAQRQAPPGPRRANKILQSLAKKLNHQRELNLDSRTAISSLDDTVRCCCRTKGTSSKKDEAQPTFAATAPGAFAIPYLFAVLPT